MTHSFPHSQSGCHLCQDALGFLKRVELERKGVKGEGRRRDVIASSKSSWSTVHRLVRVLLTTYSSTGIPASLAENTTYSCPGGNTSTAVREDIL